MDLTSIGVIEFEDAFAADFARLNYQWIEHYFSVEPHDREMLDHPKEFVIDPGGLIFFAMVNGDVVGTVALINAGVESFELAKMAVSPGFQGLGIGDRLMEACIEHARRKGKRSIFLLSNTILEPAIRLYRKHGFVETTLDLGAPYERVNIRMELAIPGASM